MSGREEQDLQREKWIKEKLKSEPQVLTDYMLSIKRKASSTRKAYLGYISKYLQYMNEQGIDYTKVMPMHMDRYIDSISKSNGNDIINAKLAAISSFYNFLVKNKLTEDNPCEKEMKLKINKKDTVTYMTDEEVELVKEEVEKNNGKHASRDVCIVTLGCATGLRVSAIRNIDIEDIDFDEKIIHVVEKGNKQRDVYFGDNTAEIIKRWLIDRQKQFGTTTGPLFMSQKKNRLSVRTIQEMIQHRTVGIDKHITPHKMRSTCAMKLYELTGDIYLTAQQLGHSNISNTMIYAKATDNKRREAAALLD